MPVQFDDDDDDDPPQDWEGPHESDIDPDESDDAPDLVPCPYCGKDVVEFAELCPHCLSYISREDALRRRRTGLKIWVIVAAVLALIGVLVWAL